MDVPIGKSGYTLWGGKRKAAVCVCVFVFLTNKDFTPIIEESKWSRYRLHGNPQSSIGTMLHNDALYTPMGSFILKEVKEETC